MGTRTIRYYTIAKSTVQDMGLSEETVQCGVGILVYQRYTFELVFVFNAGATKKVRPTHIIQGFYTRKTGRRLTLSSFPSIF